MASYDEMWRMQLMQLARQQQQQRPQQPPGGMGQGPPGAQAPQGAPGMPQLPGGGNYTWELKVKGGGEPFPSGQSPAPPPAMQQPGMGQSRPAPPGGARPAPVQAAHSLAQRAVRMRQQMGGGAGGGANQAYQQLHGAAMGSGIPGQPAMSAQQRDMTLGRLTR